MDVSNGPQSTPPKSVWEDVSIFARGLCIGSADVVPGVSGGTVALVLGIYRRLIGAISQFDHTTLRLLLQRKFSELAQQVDFRFLAALGLGIVVGFVITLKGLAQFLDMPETRPIVMAIFFGMILGAVVLVARLSTMLSRTRVPSSPLEKGMAVLIGLGIALLLSQLNPADSSTPPSAGYLFVCGMFGICAMILPGISGALVLILLGVYEYNVRIAKEILHFENLGPNLFMATCFAAGCAVGLALFSRILRRLLDQRPGPTLALLCGLMLGSLPKLWPYQINLTPPEVTDPKHFVYEPVWPDSIDSVFWTRLAVIVISFAFVLAANWLAERTSGQPTTI